MFIKQLFHYCLQLNPGELMKAYDFIARFWECDGKNEDMTIEEKIEFVDELDRNDFAIGHLGIRPLSYY